MSRKNLLITFLLFGLSYPMLAQKNETIQFYLSPHIGVEWSLATFENKKEKPSHITTLSPLLSGRYGVSLIADFKRKFSLELGYVKGDIGWSLKYEIKEKGLVDAKRAKVSSRSFRHIRVKRLNVKLVKPVKVVKIKRRKEKDFTGDPLKIPDTFRYWTVFDINILAGLSYEYISPFSRGGTLRTTSGIDFDTVKLGNTWETANPSGDDWGGGVFVGCSLQFYKWNTRRLELRLIYQKGLNKRIITKWETSVNGVSSPTFKTFTRGSMLTVHLAYPIPLFKIRGLSL